ncbi:hypothetical protein Bca4012_060296 [Brassica carinata]|uniref:Uncharacterized protein n=1 Tax=Brassica carinata TaxID=52824 RepID=A0A8X7S917_BRACI|nr:hypothetical protein Bca52824_030614 [Brassica carinata]
MATIWFLSVVFLTCFLLTAFRRKKQQQGPPSPPGFPIIGNLHQLGDLQHQSLWKLSKKAREFSYNYLDISFSPFDDYWKELRRMCLQELFRVKRLHSIQPIKDEEVKKLIDSVRESASQRSPVNLSEKFLALTVSVICKAAFGLSFQGTVLNNDRFNKLAGEGFLFLGSFSASDFFPNGGWIIGRLTGLQGWREREV